MLNETLKKNSGIQMLNESLLSELERSTKTAWELANLYLECPWHFKDETELDEIEELRRDYYAQCL